MNLPSILSTLREPGNLFFVTFMAVLALIDIVTYFRASPTKPHRNFKGEIVGLGILGTFWGIFVGLQDFDTAQIQSSIPTLL